MSNDHYAVLTVHDFSALREIAPTLALQTNCSNIFQTPLWFENLFATALRHASDAQLFLVRDLRDPEIQLCLPMARISVQPTRFSPRKLFGLANYYSSLFGPIAGTRALECGDIYRALAAAIKHDRPACDIVDLHPLDVDSPFFSNMRSALSKEGFIVDTYSCFGNWYLQVGGRSFDEYFTSLPSQLRNTIKRKRRRLKDTGSAKLTVFTEANEALTAAIDAYLQVYLRSWKVPEPFPEFIPSLCRIAAREGWLRLGLLSIDDQPIAAQIWFVKNGQALIYKLAYDERFADMSGGTLVSAALMQHVIDIDKVAEVDYLTGDDAYKRDWMSHRRERRGIVAFNSGTAAGWTSAIRHGAGRIARALHLRD